VGDCVHDGVHEGGGTADGGALPDALGADRVVRAGGDDLVQLPLRHLPGGGNEVVHVVGADAVAGAVEGDELHVRHGIGLGEAAHDLAFHDHGVDAHAAVVDGDELEDLPHAGVGIDLDHGDVTGEGPRHVGRVVVGVVLQPRLQPVGHVGVGRQGALLDRRSPLGRVPDVEAPELPL